MKKAKILVVDDNTKILYSFRTFLEKEGYINISADQGKEALNLIATEKPSLVILDISLADADGMEILRQIKLKNSTLPVIIVSSYYSDEKRNQAENLGASAFLMKPISLTSIREVLSKLRLNSKF